MASQDDPDTKQNKRAELVQQVIDHCIDRRAAGEQVTDEAVLEAHPDLRPELEKALQDLLLIQQAFEQKNRLVASETQDWHATKNAEPGLNVRCPHCNNPVAIADDDSISEILCPACGSNFSLTDDTDRTFQARRNEMINQFQLLDRVGAGAFGSVWSARDTQLDRLVAIKIPRKGQLTPTDAEQFIREARAAAQLNHPNIVSVLEVGRYKDRIYIASDFVQGLDLADWLTDQTAMPTEAAKLCVTVADALQHAHEKGVVHRDIKPSNIMLDAEGEPYLMDFGLAKREAGEVTMTVDGKLLGTPAYMSPEQARGAAHDADARSDVYSLGVILFELLTGERPFRGNTRMLLHHVLIDDAPSPRTLNSRIPRDLETICLKCLEKAPDRRYQTARELNDDLNRFLRNEPVVARPISKFVRAARWCTRKPLVSSLAALLIAAVFTGLMATTTLWQRAELNAFEAKSEADRADQKTRDANLLLYQSLIREAQSRRQARRSGYRDETWTRLGEAMKLNVPQADPLELRREAAACLGDFVGHAPRAVSDFSSTIRAIATDRLSTQFATGHDDGLTSIRRLPDGDETDRFSGPGPVHDLCFRDNDDPLAKASMIVTYDIGDYYEVWFWDRDDAGWNSQPMDVEKMVAFHVNRKGTDGVVVTQNGLVSVRSMDDESASKEFSMDGQIESVALSDDANRLAVAFKSDEDVGDRLDWGVRVWDLENDIDLGVVRPKLDIVQRLRFSESGDRFACACTNGLAIYDSNSLERIAFLQGDICNSVAFGKGDELLAFSSGQEKIVQLWNASTNREVVALQSPGVNTSVAFTEDGEALLIASDRSVRISTLASGPEKRDLFGHRMGVPGVAFDPIEGQLASVSKDGTIRFWNTADGKPERIIADASNGSESVAFTPDGRLMAVGNWSASVSLWDKEIKTQLKEVPAVCGPMIWSLTFSPDGRFLAACGLNGIQLWKCTYDQSSDDVAGIALETIDVPKTIEAYYICFSPDSRLLAWAEWIATDTESDYTRIRAWDIATETELSAPTTKLPGPGNQSLAFLADSNVIAFVTRDNRLEGWDLRADKRQFEFSLQSAPNGQARTNAQICLNPNGHWVAITTIDRRAVEIWDLQTRKQIVQLPSEPGVIWRTSWNSEGSRLAIARSNGQLAIWNLPEVKRQLDAIGLAWPESSE